MLPIAGTAHLFFNALKNAGCESLVFDNSRRRTDGRSALGESFIDSVTADAGEKGRQALSCAGKNGQEAMNNVRDVGGTLGTAIEKSITTRPYTTLALAVAAGFLFGATWRR